MRLLSFVAAWLAAGWLACPAADAAPPAGGDAGALAPRLVLEPRDGTTRIWIEAIRLDGSPARRLLRETGARVVADRTGGDPAGRAAFATWGEDGQTWFTYRRDAGPGWSEPRRLAQLLRLRDGAAGPGAPLPPVPDELRLPADGGVWIVQLRTISLPEWRSALTAAGARLLAFFPDNAHLVALPADRRGALEALDFVQRIEPYHPGYRLDPGLHAWLADTSGPSFRRVNVLAFGWGPAAKQRIARAAAALGAEVVANWPSGHRLQIELDREALRRLAAHDDVMAIDGWGPPETDMNLVRQDSGADAEEAGFGSCGQGVRGEVLDTGCEETHQDFDGITLHGANSAASHGTRSYGVVFANGDRDGDGDGSASGHLPCGEGICADIDFLGDRFAHTQELKDTPYFASFQSNSWGSPRSTAYTSDSFEIDDIIWRLDIAIVQSQSNAGDQDSRPEAWGKNVISVGGVQHQNTLDPADDFWSDASIGPAADGRIKPDLHYWDDAIRTTTTGNSYTSSFSGTSAAAPSVAGVLGLFVQLWSDDLWNTGPVGATVFDRQPHFATIKALLINNAQQYAFSGTGHNLTRTHQGWGRPSVDLARQRAATSFIVDQDDPLELGQRRVWFLEVPPGETELRVTMVYPDPPGTTTATLHRINDLDLAVVSPSGVTYHGNFGLDAGTASVPGGAPNGVDTVENVFVVDPQPGVWTVKVTAAEVNQDAHLDTPVDDATYALVVTGADDTLPPYTPSAAGANGGPLRVTDYDPATGVISLAYGPACAATDHVIEYGELTPANLAGYAWSGTECAVGTTGVYAWSTLGLPDSLFFVIVGRNATVEGSYGLDSAGAERPEDALSPACPRPQDLSDPCF